VPRNRALAARPPFDVDTTAPVVVRAGFEASVQAFVVWANSATLRAQLMEATEFPLPGDLLAFLLVNQLVHRGAGRPTDMAEAIQTTTSNVTKVVRRLEAAGLVTRGPDPDDARGVVIALTPDGRDVGERIVASLGGVIEAAFAGWSVADRDRFEQLAVRFVRDLDSASDRAVSAISGVTWMDAEDR
jgi:DNA-binding MarR family transcriptional regulator